MSEESFWALVGVVLTLVGIYVPTRIQIRKNRQDQQNLIDQRQQETIARAVNSATAPLEARIAELREQIEQLHNDQQRGIDNAVAQWRERANGFERDRDYWRAMALAAHPVNLLKVPDTDPD